MLIHVVLRLDTGYDRAILRGAIAQARLHPTWDLSINPFTNDQKATERMLLADRPAGVVGRIIGSSLWQCTADIGAKVVSVTHMEHRPDCCRVGVDDTAAGAMAAEHLLEKGFHHFGFLGVADAALSHDRLAGFAGAIEAAGCHVEVGPSLGWGPGLSALSPQEQTLLDWLKQLPKPTGILLMADSFAKRVLRIAALADLQVPEDLALVGVDNDDLLCEISSPPLTSVMIPGERIGIEAVNLLAELLAENVDPPVCRLLPPSRIVCRRSSDVHIARHPELNRALQFIRVQSHRPISVDELMAVAALSRRALEQACRRHLGRTPLQLIHRAHVETARKLLVETTLSIDQVAMRSGLVSREQLSRVFKKNTGQSPAQFRKNHQSVLRPRFNA